jgi:APA family basic amino acid/polyamine antiporter
MIMAGPRVYAAMAADRALPQVLARHNHRGVPVVAVITQGVLATLFVVVGDPDTLIHFVGFTLAIFAGLAVIAVYRLRAMGMSGAYKTFGYPITPAVFVLSSVWIAYAQISEQPAQSAIIGCVLGLGGVVYWLTTRGKPPLASENDPADTPPSPSGRFAVVPEARARQR